MQAPAWRVPLLTLAAGAAFALLGCAEQSSQTAPAARPEQQRAAAPAGAPAQAPAVPARGEIGGAGGY